jgi:L-ectoine synthase
MEDVMIIRSLDEVVGTDRDVAGDGWRSRRLMLRRDGLGFSLHDTTVAAGADMELQYRHHLEACYCLEGEAEITDLASGAAHAIRPGTVYALDQHDRHRLQVGRDLRLVCVFNPALSGGETHDATGGFPPPEEA